MTGRKRFQQGARAIPKNLDADANEKKRREPQNDAHPAFADDGGEAIRESVTKIDTYGYESGANHPGENRREIMPDAEPFVGPPHDLHQDVTPTYDDLKRENVK